MLRTLRFWARLVAAAATAAYLAAIALPFVVLQPGLTGYPVLDRFVEVFFGADFTPLDFDLSDVVVSLWVAGEYALAVVFAVVCFVCPALKLAGLFVLTARRASARRAVRALEVFLRLAGRLSMVDVLVTAVLIVGVKEFPGNSALLPQIGFYFFFASAVLSIIAGVLCELLHRRSHPHPSPRRGQSHHTRRSMMTRQALLVAALATAVGCERPPAAPLPELRPAVVVGVKAEPQPADADFGILNPKVRTPKVPDPPVRVPRDDDWKSPVIRQIEDEASGKTAALRRLYRDAVFHGTPPDEVRKMHEAIDKEYAGKRR